MNADSTSKFRPLLEDMNKDRGRSFANGGIVGDNAQQSTAPAAAPAAPDKTPQINVVNVLDPAMVDDYMTTPAGDRTFINLVERNKGSLNTLLRS